MLTDFFKICECLVNELVGAGLDIGAELRKPAKHSRFGTELRSPPGNHPDGDV
jgi:hypothetical protein